VTGAWVKVWFFFLKPRGLFLALDLSKEIQAVNWLLSSSLELERIRIHDYDGQEGLKQSPITINNIKELKKSIQFWSTLPPVSFTFLTPLIIASFTPLK
jgi:hypothetical protein